jgi:hypothetical protein
MSGVSSEDLAALAQTFRTFAKRECRNSSPLYEVLSGSWPPYRVEEARFGEPPGPVSEEPFVKTWVDVWATYGETLLTAERDHG